MNILYKYYSEQFDVIEHLLQPAIKLATTKSLNDPFERNLPNELAYELSDQLIKKEKINDNNSSALLSFKDQFREISKAYGVVSLTEENRNILMWAHYSSSHKGVSIGYKPTIFEDIKEKQSKLNGALKGEYLPRKIKYSDKRLEIDRNNEYGIHDLIMSSMCTKSDHWEYENEHRCIIPLSWSDMFISPSETSKELSSTIYNLLKEGIICKSTKNKNKTMTHYFRSPENQLKDTEAKINLAENQEIMMMKNINISHISEIYLGATFCKDKTDSIRNFIESCPEKYGHISVYKYRLNFNQFLLDLMPVANNKTKFPLSDMIVERNLDPFNLIPKGNILDVTDR
ncbi:TPA: DUF2971 domain-containing protein [Aeromonas dhakensis]|nr:DUF2971 domain-containing protein [Aeromonas dhakensis]